MMPLWRLGPLQVDRHSVSAIFPLRDPVAQHNSLFRTLIQILYRKPLHPVTQPMLDLKIPITIPVPDPPKSVWRSTDITQDALRQKAVGFNRLGRSSVEGSLQRHFLPFKGFIDAFCSAGPRLEVMFPSCWDGINTDSSDHRSHVAFPSLVQDGVCGDNFAARIPTLLYEIS